MNPISSLPKTIKSYRVPLSFIIGGLFIYFSIPTPKSIILGVPVIFIGEAIRTWASGIIKKGKEIANHGPYAVTRNPLYLGTFFIGAGFSLMSNNYVIMILFLIIFLFVYTFTIKNEEKELTKIFGPAYLNYKNSVPVFFPSLSYLFSLPSTLLQTHHASETIFDWGLVKKHREFNTWIGIIGCIVIFIFKVLY
ncbi:MAG: isoprenylcysteine carboxylmethyltransferase family protein [Nitrospirae bacterium]|nr:isoprenylcysteine carboxylmethyltransferase family protein [Nitrospirota bacterium]